MKHHRSRDATEHAMPGKRHRARDATEHAMPSSSVATEGAAGADEEFQEMLLTPAAQRTEEIWISPCKLLCMTHDIRMLSRMQDEIRSRFRVPVALEQLLHTYACNQQYSAKGKSWSSTIEAISRCSAAFQKAAAATEHTECQGIANQICDYAIDLTNKTPAYCVRTDLLTIVHQFIENRTYNLAFTALLDESFIKRHCRSQDELWPFDSVGQQKDECLLIMDMCMHAIKNHADHLLWEVEVHHSRPIMSSPRV
jgi:hypothetical protein